jgi:hypothetical protein
VSTSEKGQQLPNKTDKGRELKIAILQSCYLPWKGYFDIIGSVDVFVVYDDVQFRKNHWHNRNLIKTHQGMRWLSVPVSKPEGIRTPIRDIRLAGRFAEKHWRSIEQAYARATAFERYGPALKSLFETAEGLDRLTPLNLFFINAITKILGFNTEIVMAETLNIPGHRTERLVGICKALGATSYLSGPAAKTYLDVAEFDRAGVTVEWMDYSGYASYGQLHGPFVHEVSILDLLLNVGERAIDFMKAGTARPSH